jgi:hypothetical protein
VLVQLVDAGVDRPISMTSGEISMMKRASDVPPVVVSSGDWPVWRLQTSVTVCASLPWR